MNRESVIKILSILKAAYPNSYKELTKQEAESIISLYQTMFQDSDVDLVILAIKELINTFHYPPTIADIKDKMDSIKNMSNDKSNLDLWAEVKEAINMPYDEMPNKFNSLSPEVKAFFKSPQGIKELAMMDSETINSVTKGQFFKQIDILKARNKQERMMLPETKKRIEELYSNSFKLLGEG